MSCFLHSDDLRGLVQIHPYPKDLIRTTNQVRVLVDPGKSNDGIKMLETKEIQTN